MSILRNVGAVLLGTVAGGALVALVEMLGHRVYPPPAGVDLEDPEQVAELVAAAPAGALLMVVLAWAVGAFGGGAVAAWIGREAGVACALTVGALLLLAGLANLLVIPGHPAWFWIVGLGAFLPAAWLGARLVRRRPASGG